MQNDLAMAQRLAVVADEPVEREREQTVHAGIHESPGLAGLLVQKMREGSVRQDVFAPYHRISEHDDIRRGDLLKTPFVEPVVFAERVRDAVIGTRLETFELFPQRRGQPNNG